MSHFVLDNVVSAGLKLLVCLLASAMLTLLLSHHPKGQDVHSSCITFKPILEYLTFFSDTSTLPVPS